MLILALSDIHGQAERLARIASGNEGVDLVAIAGDLTDFGGAAELDAVIDALGRLAEGTVTVAGNCDKRSARERLEERGISCEGRVVERGGALVAGAGGGMLRMGLTPYERHEEEIASSLQEAIDEAGAWEGRAPLVALSHQPPRESGADLRRGSYTGSTELRAILELAQPVLWICGHIHESPCANELGRCLVVNPGPASSGCYALARVDRSASGAWGAKAELYCLAP